MPQLHDQQHREESLSWISTPILLEAGAGTGKTAVLVERIILWVMGEGFKRARESLKDNLLVTEEEIARKTMQGVVAITFTEKAALELATRLDGGLSDLCKGKPMKVLRRDLLGMDDEDIQRRAGLLKQEAGHAQLGTIHSFCAQMVRRHALVLGIHPGFEIDPNGQKRQVVIEQVLEASLNDPDSEECAAIFEAEGVGIGPSQLVEGLNWVFSHSISLEMLRREFTPEDWGSKQFEEIKQEVVRLNQLIPENSQGRLKGVNPVKEFLVLLINCFEIISNGEFYKIQDKMEAGFAKKLKDWADNKFTKSENDLFLELVPEVCGLAKTINDKCQHFFKLDPAAFAALQKSLCLLAERVRQECTYLGILAYDDLLNLTARLMEDKNILAFEKKRMSHLLVDEFQDTDWVQCDLVKALSMSGDSAEDLCLFVVGDPKQSIYGFRRADLSAYDDFKNTILKHSGKVLELTANFRSVPGILEESVRLLSDQMVEEVGVQPKFQALQPTKDAFDFQDKEITPVEFWVNSNQESRKKVKVAEIRKLEADGIRNDLIRLKESGDLKKWSNAAILFRHLSQQSIYLESLRLAGIPVQAQKEKDFYTQRTIQQLRALLRIVLDPLDELAVVTVLRSVWVGVPDKALFPLWQSGFLAIFKKLGHPGEFNADGLNQLLNGISGSEIGKDLPNWKYLLIHFCHYCHLARQSFSASSWEVFRLMIEECLFLLMPLLASDGGAHQLALCRRFFIQALDILQSPLEGETHLLAYLRNPGQFGEKEIALQSPEPNAVWMMTIHQSKGLEFDFVYFADLDNQGRRGRENSFNFSPRPVPAKWRFFDLPSPDYDQVRRETIKREDAENVRLLYVAATRAKKRLVFLGNFSKKSDKVVCLGDLVRNRRDIPPILQEKMESGEPSWVDPMGIKWVFMNSEMISDCPPLAARKLTGNLAQGLEWESQLVAMRADALTCQGQPLSRAVSQESHEARRDEDLGRLESFTFGESIPVKDPRAYGVLVHKFFEILDLSLTVEEAMEKALEELPSYAANLLMPLEMVETLNEVEDFFNRPQGKKWVEELYQPGVTVLARELPFVLKEEVAMIGTIDLVLEKKDGEIFVVDFKTGNLDEERREHYLAQGAIYTKVIMESLGLPSQPKFEVWGLASGEKVTFVF